MATLVPQRAMTIPDEDAARPLVLLVDDNHAVREACALFCERSGFDVAHAADAPEAVEKALLLRPEAIVLDLVLPTMPGWEVARQLRADRRTAHIPILATSGLVASEAERKARAAGATHYIAKPFDGRTLVSRLRQILEA
jgi:chemosensory pili system protein ChpA (sensor histidine kinase/response regulator)